MQNFIIILIATLNLFLGIFSYIRNRKKLANLFFAVIAVGIFLWSLGITIYNSFSITNDLFWANFVYFGASFAIIGFFLFSLYFPYGRMTNNNFYRTIIVLVLITLFALPFIPKGIFSEVIREEGSKKLILNMGFYLYSFLSLALFVFSLGYLFYKYMNSKELTKLQLRYFFFGALLTTIFGITFNIIFPLFGDSSMNWGLSNL